MDKSPTIRDYQIQKGFTPKEVLEAVLTIAKVTKTELSKLSGLNQSYFSHVKQNTHNLSLVNLVAICESSGLEIIIRKRKKKRGANDAQNAV